EEDTPLPPNGGGDGTRDKRTRKTVEPSSDFNLFWNAYPRKVKKPVAERAWAKVSPTPEEVAKIIDAVERSKKSDDWQREEGRFVPHPSTWLNHRRWEDEFSVATEAPLSAEDWAEKMRRQSERIQGARSDGGGAA